MNNNNENNGNDNNNDQIQEPGRTEMLLEDDELLSLYAEMDSNKCSPEEEQQTTMNNNNNDDDDDQIQQILGVQHDSSSSTPTATIGPTTTVSTREEIRNRKKTVRKLFSTKPRSDPPQDLSGRVTSSIQELIMSGSSTNHQESSNATPTIGPRTEHAMKVEFEKLIHQLGGRPCSLDQLTQAFQGKEITNIHANEGVTTERVAWWRMQLNQTMHLTEETVMKRYQLRNALFKLMSDGSDSNHIDSWPKAREILSRVMDFDSDSCPAPAPPPPSSPGTTTNIPYRNDEESGPSAEKWQQIADACIPQNFKIEEQQTSSNEEKDTLINKLENTLQTERANHQRELTNMAASHQRELEELVSSHQQELEELVSSHQQELADKETAHQRVLQGKDEEITGYKRFLNRMVIKVRED